MVYTVLQQRFPKEQLRMVLSKLVANLLVAASAEREGVAPCGGMPMRICHQVAETAEEDLLPHMDSIAGMLGAQCGEQIDEGQDMSESVALEALGMLASTLTDLWEKEEEEDEDEDEDQAAEEAAGSKKKSKGGFAALATNITDKATTLANVTRSVVGVFAPLLAQLWPELTVEPAGAACGACAATAAGLEANAYPPAAAETRCVEEEC